MPMLLVLIFQAYAETRFMYGATGGGRESCICNETCQAGLVQVTRPSLGVYEHLWHTQPSRRDAQDSHKHALMHAIYHIWIMCSKALH